MEILKTNALTKRYRKTMALNEVNITIHQGDIYGFIGKNGAGKTTLIRVIAGIAEPTSGTFSLFGQTQPLQVVRARKRIAAVVESPALHLNLSAYQNLKLQCILLGIPQPHAKAIEEVLVKVDLQRLLIEKKKKAKNFSLGMRQRLGIAMALLSKPEFLILDEPNNGLDPEGIRDLRTLLMKLNREDGVTMLISSHMLTELAKLATRYGFIDHGKVLKEITSDELLKQSKQATVLIMNEPTLSVSKLKEKGLKDFVLNGNELRIEGNPSMQPYLLAIAEQGLEVINMTKETEDLEAFFMQMIQGGR
jgi:ABC-2 type transport system ATP-binding protein